MTDSELLEYLGLPDGPDERAYVANLSSGHRSAYERMREAEDDIKLWQAGVAPKPTGVILCHEHKPKRRRGWMGDTSGGPWGPCDE